MSKKPIGQRLLSKCRINEIGCWEWAGGCDRDGYGQMRVDGKTAVVHRLAYEAFIGPIPEGLQVNHHCDNPKCFNPDHLWADTQKANVQDCLRKGRLNTPKGEKNGAYSHGFFAGLKKGTPEWNEARRKVRTHRKSLIKANV